MVVDCCCDELFSENEEEKLDDEKWECCCCCENEEEGMGDEAMCSCSDGVIEQYRRAECAPIRLERLSISFFVVVVAVVMGCSE